MSGEAPGLGAVLAADLAAALDPVPAFGVAVGSAAEPWQAKVLRSRARRRLLLCARQVGKSTTAAVLAVLKAVYADGALVLCVAPAQRQSDELLAKIKQAHRALGSPVTAVGDSAEALRLSNGSRVLSLPGTATTVRGYSAVDLLMLDEAAWVPDDVYAAVLPMVRLGGQVIGLSTPGARVGWFFDAWMDESDLWERHLVTALESAQYPRERLVERRRMLSRRKFATDCMCEFGGINDAVFDPEAVEDAVVPAGGQDVSARLAAARLRVQAKAMRKAGA